MIGDPLGLHGREPGAKKIFEETLKLLGRGNILRTHLERLTYIHKTQIARKSTISSINNSKEGFGRGYDSGKKGGTINTYPLTTLLFYVCCSASVLKAS